MKDLLCNIAWFHVTLSCTVWCTWQQPPLSLSLSFSLSLWDWLKASPLSGTDAIHQQVGEKLPTPRSIALQITGGGGLPLSCSRQSLWQTPPVLAHSCRGYLCPGTPVQGGEGSRESLRPRLMETNPAGERITLWSSSLLSASKLDLLRSLPATQIFKVQKVTR